MIDNFISIIPPPPLSVVILNRELLAVYQQAEPVTDPFCLISGMTHHY